MILRELLRPVKVWQTTQLAPVESLSPFIKQSLWARSRMMWAQAVAITSSNLRTGESEAVSWVMMRNLTKWGTWESRLQSPLPEVIIGSPFLLLPLKKSFIAEWRRLWNPSENWRRGYLKGSQANNGLRAFRSSAKWAMSYTQRCFKSVSGRRGRKLPSWGCWGGSRNLYSHRIRRGT